MAKKARQVEGPGYLPRGLVGISRTAGAATTYEAKRVYARHGPWCVTRGIGESQGLWAITHAPSGYRALTRPTRIEAEGLMVLVAEKTGELWPKEVLTVGFPDFVREQQAEGGTPATRAMYALVSQSYPVAYLAAVVARGTGGRRR